MPKWLEDAVFYEIYPQTFYDTNGDGIGDFEGIIQKLDYIRGIGCNALWINPCFDSPFKDAGYDVRDYKKTASRYGTNEDLFRLFDEAHKRGIHVLLDLVPGHTSEEHAWFTESKKAEPNEYSNRYIWTDFWIKKAEGWFGSIGGEADRNGMYIVNFFKCQPALNYGFLNPTESWQLPMDHPDSIATREALKDIIRFWLSGGDSGRGCDGFRVDMANSLVKGDDEKWTGTSRIWQNIRQMLDTEFPEAALVSEWSAPPQAIKAGFHMDFLLDHQGGGYNTLVRNYKMDYATQVIEDDNSYFKKDGKGDITRFLDEYIPWYESTKNDGYISIITGNHDTPRISANLSPRELSLAYALFFTLPGVPFLYYGDEIGMRYLGRLKTKEGGFTRTGSRTPMQWSNTASGVLPAGGVSGKNRGFSTADEAKLYLPVDSSPDAPTVEAQEKDPGSLLNTVKALLRLRHGESDLQGKANLEIIHADKASPFIYRRGSFILAVNPTGKAAEAPVKSGSNIITVANSKPVYAIGGGSIENGVCTLEAQSFGVWKL
ncbi:alpha-amylase [Betaproteobacteria bacterium]|nr:alpha-amylase [Betaproteobacteria bacterium]